VSDDAPLPPPHRFARAQGWLRDPLHLWVTVAVVATLVAAGSLFYVYNPFREDYDFISFDQYRTRDHLEALTALGPRITGTPSEAAAAQYVEAQFNASGLVNIQTHRFPWTTYDIHENGSSPAVTISRESDSNTSAVAPVTHPLTHLDDFAVLGYAGSLHADDIEVVFIGNGDEANYSAAGDVAGRAVFAECNGTYDYSGLYLRAIEHGAAVSLLFNAGQLLPITSTSAGLDSHGHYLPFPEAYPRHRDALIPHLMLSDAVGRQLKRWTADAAQHDDMHTLIDVEVEVTIAEREVLVVTGDVAGASPDVVLVGAHMDSHYVSAGAIDNAVGTATVIELARQLAGTPDLQYTLRFAAWGGEEQALLGSYGYYLEHKMELRSRLKLYLNFDMNHAALRGEYANRLFLETGNSAVINGLLDIREAWEREYPELARTYDVTITSNDHADPSDHLTFWLEGFPTAAAYGSGSEDEYHTVHDTLDQLNLESVQVTPLILGTYARHVAREGEL